MERESFWRVRNIKTKKKIRNLFRNEELCVDSSFLSVGKCVAFRTLREKKK